MEQKLKLETLGFSDYDMSEDGLKVVNWCGLAKRNRNLIKLQEIHRPILRRFLDSLGYEITKEWRENDGFGDSLNIDHFNIMDRRDGSTKHITGSDDNCTIYVVDCGRSRWKSVPGTTAWYKAEIAARED